MPLLLLLSVRLAVESRSATIFLCIIPVSYTHLEAPLTMLFDYVKIRFPTLDIQHIIKMEVGRGGNWNVLIANLKRQGVEVHFKHKAVSYTHLHLNTKTG